MNDFEAGSHFSPWSMLSALPPPLPQPLTQTRSVSCGSRLTRDCARPPHRRRPLLFLQRLFVRCQESERTRTRGAKKVIGSHHRPPMTAPLPPLLPDSFSRFHFLHPFKEKYKFLVSPQIGFEQRVWKKWISFRVEENKNLLLLKQCNFLGREKKPNENTSQEREREIFICGAGPARCRSWKAQVFPLSTHWIISIALKVRGSSGETRRSSRLVMDGWTDGQMEGHQLETPSKNRPTLAYFFCKFRLRNAKI